MFGAKGSEDAKKPLPSLLSRLVLLMLVALLVSFREAGSQQQNQVINEGQKERSADSASKTSTVDSRKFDLKVLGTDDHLQIPLAQALVGQVLIVKMEELRVGKLRGLLIEARNTSDRPVVFDGSLAIAKLEGQELKSSTLKQIQNSASPGTSKTRLAARGLGAALSVGAVSTVQDAIKYSGPVLSRYGGDQNRRESEHKSFEKRALWPDETSEGFLFFTSKTSLKNAELSMPVYTLYNENDRVIVKSAVSAGL